MPPPRVCPLPSQKKLPPDLELLPGHIFQLLEALREERRDSAATPGTSLASGTPVSPAKLVPPLTPVPQVTPVSPAGPVSPAPSEP